jgi:predicted DNA-binding transcriptional regulator AlpA
MSKELEPNEIVRWSAGPKYFGLKRTALNEKIKSGEIPPPMPLSDNGRATGWLGRVIIEWQASRLAKATHGAVKRSSK